MDQPSRPTTTSDLARIHVERQRAQAYADTCAADAIKARIALERVMAEEAMAVATLERLDGLVRDAMAALKKVPVA